ncbi:ABC transporter substrate-binding protein [Corynebacterium aquilae]|uniref:ABC transporter substrate-binding protein n=1 Tax=Corynebacterium aquilae DSM 44791 TaxID=1431546 RepID=A0A1L7CFL9_9CORY|nr:ABC transporter substrate-binding protein [Corynebacterium aquilae]APT84652.1 ABC transporter substrate-binding protein [Corynebacterium aquilae DSM 44791]
MNSSQRRTVAALVSLSAVLATLTGCVTNSEIGEPPGWEPIIPETNPEVAALVPAEIAERGTISIATNPPFAPAEFKDSDGNIIGFEIDLARAVAATMGLEMTIQDQDFSMILPAVQAGTVDFGASGFTDNEERRKSFDFVDFFVAGIQWASQTGKPVDPDNACGLTVAVQRGTVSDTDDVQGRSDACVAAGKEPIKKLAYDSSDAAATALVLGKADAFSADSPVTAYAVARSDGKIQLSGEMFDAAPYGWPVQKGSDLGPAIAAGLDSIMKNGDYNKILDTWGITEGHLSEAMINGNPA